MFDRPDSRSIFCSLRSSRQLKFPGIFYCLPRNDSISVRNETLIVKIVECKKM